MIEISSAGNVLPQIMIAHIAPLSSARLVAAGMFRQVQFLSLAVLCLDLNLQKPAATDNGRRRPCEGVQRMQAAKVALRRKPGLLSAVLKVSQI